jgi:septum formation protein
MLVLGGIRVLILASASPRRRDLLREWGYTFIQSDVSVSEVFPDGVTPEEGVQSIARRKAVACARLYENQENHESQENRDKCSGTDERRVFLAADTIIVFQDSVLGKPRDRAHGRDMLRMLSGNTHRVLTGVALVQQRDGASDMLCQTRVQSTLVEFARLSDEDIDSYLDTGEWTDKAAGYAIQGQGRRLISRYEGSKTNVIGLPMDIVVPMLKSLDIHKETHT